MVPLPTLENLAFAMPPRLSLEPDLSHDSPRSKAPDDPTLAWSCPKGISGYLGQFEGLEYICSRPPSLAQGEPALSMQRGRLGRLPIQNAARQDNNLVRCPRNDLHCTMCVPLQISRTNEVAEHAAKRLQESTELDFSPLWALHSCGHRVCCARCCACKRYN